MNIQGWFPLGFTGLISLQSRLLLQSKAFSNTTIWIINSCVLSLICGPTLTSIPDYWKNHALTIHTFVSKVMSLLLNMLLRIPCSTRRSNQWILKEIKPEYSLEGLMLKLPGFSHLIHRANWLEKTLMLGKIDGKSRRGRQRMRQLDGITDSMEWVCCNPRGHKESDITQWLNNNNKLVEQWFLPAS